MFQDTLDLLEIDGSIGEGGGQVLRTSLTLSVITGRQFRIRNIRAGRTAPGLRPQHLAAVDAAQAICKAKVEGASLGSTELKFVPGELRTGRYQFKIKTAGAATLVFQTVFLPLSFGESASFVTITGGTHVPWSPLFHYLEMQWVPYLRKLGFDSKIGMNKAGFYPQGGGKISTTIRPKKEIRPLSLSSRGKLIQITGTSGVANLPTSIANRQKRQAQLRLQNLNWEGHIPKIQIKTLDFQSQGKGTFIILLAEFEDGHCCFSALGELRKPAERVADEAVDQLIEFMAEDGNIDQYLADQILLPLSIANGVSNFRTSKVTKHLRTNAEIITAFLSTKILIEGQLGQAGLVQITPEST